MPAEKGLRMADPGSSETRRSFLRTATVALGGAVGVILAVPLVRYVLFPVGRKTVTSSTEPIDVMAASALVAGAQPVQVAIVAGEQRDAWGTREKVGVGSVWLSKDRSGRVTAFSGACPHLGCAIALDQTAKVFRCPCHKSAFGLDGQKQAGPSERGLDPLPVAVEGGRVKVTFLRFRPDVPERTPV
jgi:menaquinol-cytochrome c reductase iron-sulfur subunit